MRKLRLFLVTALMASTFVVASAAPASANCEGDPNVCVLVCEIGTSNKYTEELFTFCYVW